MRFIMNKQTKNSLKPPKDSSFQHTRTSQTYTIKGQINSFTVLIECYLLTTRKKHFNHPVKEGFLQITISLMSTWGYFYH